MFTQHKKYISNYIVGETPGAVQDRFEYFVQWVGSSADRKGGGYCGAYCRRGESRPRYFHIPGAVRKDGLFDSALEAQDALNKFLEGLSE